MSDTASDQQANSPELESTPEPVQDGRLTGPPPVRRPRRERYRLEGTPSQRRALGWFAAAALLLLAWVAQPMGAGILIGTLTAFTLQPLYRTLCLRFRRPSLAALVCALLAGLGFLTCVGGLGYLLVRRGVVLAQDLIRALGPGGGLRSLAESASKILAPLHIQVEDLLAKLREAAANFAQRAAELAKLVAEATFSGLLLLFFALMTVFFILRHWESLRRHAEDMLPLAPRHTRALFEEFRDAGRTTLLGTVLTGVTQGALAGVGYLVTGVPEPAFFGALTAVASLFPGVGTLLIWVPAGIYLMATGHPARGILELIFGGLFVVGASDYVIRPRLVGGHGKTPALITFVALFGGVEVFGLVGLVLGPLLVSLAVALLRLYAVEARASRAKEADGT